jgi:hypothetical protein
MPPASSSTRCCNQPVDPLRIRRFPRQFAPVDRRLVYHKHICRMSTEAMALDLFLECVSDPQGLSFYSETRICEYLHWSLRGLWDARDRLCQAGFLLYRRPFYQLLELPDSETIR